uniref:Protein kinase domain-containing protein n=1 Tax=Chromulina nebulosa TaxID=96789 RepID=A0A6T5VXF8_9STRA|mmetsp:Transcript_2769/g.2433  ORF Transcript_2769/g.2433 Transcript_2769/m.2433 type:complete len:650 (+) Transcript_2769:53-2002(+)
MSSYQITSPWEIIKLVGKGGSSSVYKGRFTDTGKLIAIKQINIDGFNKEQILAINNEINTIKGLSHSNIIIFYGTQQTNNKINIFLEFATLGSLQSYYKKKGPMKENQAINCTKQILNGLEYLHNKGIAHRDIKCANCLLTSKGVVKLADFGASKKYESESIVSGLKGTPNWMAPEVIRGTQMTSGWMKADVWSVGCTIVEMLTAKLPFSEYDNPMTAMYHIANGKSPSLQNVDCTDDLKEFIHICCSSEPEVRPNISELVRHKLFNKSITNITPDKQKSQSIHSNSNLTNSIELTNNPITNESNQRKDSIDNNTIEEISEDEYLQEIFHDDEIDIDISTDDEISETSSVNNASYIEEEPPNDENEQTYVFNNHIDTNSHSDDITINDVDSKIDKQLTSLSLEDAVTPNINANNECLNSSRVSTAIYSPDSRKVSIGSPQTVTETTESMTTRTNDKTNNVNFEIQDAVYRPVAPMSGEHIRISNQSDDNTTNTTSINKSKSSHKLPPSHSSSTSTGRTLTSSYRKKLLKVRSKSAGIPSKADNKSNNNTNLPEKLPVVMTSSMNNTTIRTFGRYIQSAPAISRSVNLPTIPSHHVIPVTKENNKESIRKLDSISQSTNSTPNKKHILIHKNKSNGINSKSINFNESNTR